MTLTQAQKKLKEFQTSSTYNYILLSTAILTIFIAANNITSYVSQARSLKQAIKAQE